MIDDRHYIPILKGKKGELWALAKAQSVDKFTPLVEVVPIPIVHPEDGDARPSKSIDAHVRDTADAFGESMGILPMVFIDGFYIENENALQDGRLANAGLFSRLRQKGIKFIPTIGLDRTEGYIEAVQDVIAKDKDNRGCCLRLWEADLEGMSDLDGQIASLLNAIKIKAQDVYLVVDFKGKTPPKAALPPLINSLPRIDEWRALVFSSSAFPESLGKIGTNQIKESERSDWAAWLFLRNRQRDAAKRMPIFSDYGINHPDLIEDIDPRKVKLSPNIRYTDDLDFVIAKGKAQPRKKEAKTPADERARELLAPKIQYPKLAKMIKDHRSWKEGAFSEGDKRIDLCSQNRFVGGHSDWRGAGASHHIALVVQQLANLP